MSYLSESSSPDNGAKTALKLAPNHAKVYDALRDARRPMTAYELIDAVRGTGISAPPTIYRALNRLIELGLAHRLESLNAFVTCAHSDEHEHQGSAIFMICDTCGDTREIVDGSIDRQLRLTSGKSAFHMAEATIELRGHCANCEAQTYSEETGA